MKMTTRSWTHRWRPKVGWGVPVAWLTLCVVWSSTWLVIKIGLRDLPPISYAGIRFLLAIIVLLAVSVGRVRLLPQQASDYAVLAFTGVLMFAVNYGLLFWGELHVSSGLAAVLQATIPIFGMVFAHLMLPDEPLRLQKFAGALVALGGVTIICERLLGFNGWMAFWGGLGIVFGAAGAAFSNVLLKARGMQLAPAMIAGWQMIFGAVPLLVTGFIVVGAALYVEMVYAPPYWLHAALWGPLAILLPLLLLRSFKGVLIALQYKNKAQEGRLASE